MVKGDIFHHVHQYINDGNNGFSIIIPHVCNNIDLFGGGFAAAVSQKYPIVKQNYHLLGSNFLKNNPGYVQFIKVETGKSHNHQLIFANMIAQNGIRSPTNPRPLNYWSLCKSMISINQYIQQNFADENPVQIHAPKFGCGLAGGNWSFINDLIIDIWKNISVCVYEYNNRQ
jgi:hypothetical protein